MKWKWIWVTVCTALLFGAPRWVQAEEDPLHAGGAAALAVPNGARPDAVATGQPKLYDLSNACSPERLGLNKGATGALGGGSSAGAALFAMRCGTCHRPGGNPGPLNNKALGAERVLGLSARGPMPPTGLLPDASEREAIADFLRNQ